MCHLESLQHTDYHCASVELIQLLGCGPDWLLAFPTSSQVMLAAFDSVAALRRSCCVWNLDRRRTSVMSIGPGVSHLEAQNTDSDLVILEEKDSTFLTSSRHPVLA